MERTGPGAPLSGIGQGANLSRCDAGAVGEAPFKPRGRRHSAASRAFDFYLRFEGRLLVAARPMTHIPRTKSVFGSELLGAFSLRGEEAFEGCFDHVRERTLTRYNVKTILYPTQVLGSSLARGHDLRMANRLAHFRKKAGLSQEALGKALNSGRSTITKLERSEIPLSDRWLERLSEVLNCSPSDILGDTVAIVGKIGAGGSVVFEDIGIEDVVSRPPGATGELVGLEVVGESMLPKFDPGDIVYISRANDGVDPSDLGAICACRLVSGETYLKQLTRGSRAGTYTLRSYNAGDMDDCELVWATPIRAVTPRHARRFH